MLRSREIIGAGNYRCGLCGVVIDVDSTKPPIVSFVAHSGTPTERVVTIATVEVHRCEVPRSSRYRQRRPAPPAQRPVPLGSS